MPLQRGPRVLLLYSAALIACNRTDETSYVPAEVRAPAPHPTVENAAPLNNVQGRPEQARNTQADDGEMTPVAEVRLRPVAGRKVEGTAQLEEVADGVQVSLRLRQAPPGALRVGVHDMACNDIAAAVSGPKGRADLEKHSARSLGTLEIGRDGEAELTTSIPRTHLRPDQPGTILGSSLVVYAAREAERGSGIACGTVRATSP